MATIDKPVKLTITNDLTITVKSPAECTTEELRNFERLVCAGGEVTTNGLGSLLRSAKRLLFAGQDKIIGVAGIKLPNIHYKNDLFHKAGVADPENRYRVEFGWLYVSPPHRKIGVGSSLVNSAIDDIAESGCFATTRSTNAVMQKMLERYGFSRFGSNYRSGNGEYQLSLFVKTDCIDG